MRINLDNRLVSIAVLGLAVAVPHLAVWAGAPGPQAVTAPPEIDSLVWQNSEIVGLVVETFGDSQTVGYGSFLFEGTRPLDAHTATYPLPPVENPDIWLFCPDSSIAVSYRGYEGEPDHVLATWTSQLEGGTVRILEFCGTPCRYFDVQWLDERRFLFLSAVEFDEEPLDPTRNHYRLRVQVYDLALDSVYSYIAGPVEPGWHNH